MSVDAMKVFIEYFERFETAIGGDHGWDDVQECFADDARYIVEGVPFACDIQGSNAITAGFRKSTTHFDRHMDSRGLEVLSCIRTGSSSLRLGLLSTYGLESKGKAVAPVAMEISCRDGKIAVLKDIYDPEISEAALVWIATHAEHCDPSYV